MMADLRRSARSDITLLLDDVMQTHFLHSDAATAVKDGRRTVSRCRGEI